MKNIGFIGLGSMGMGMAINLVKNGFKVKGFDLREEKRTQFESHGGISVASVEEAANGSDAVFLMVMNGQQVIDIIEGSLKESLAKNATVIVSATIGRNYMKQAETLLLEAGAQTIDMPVSGGPIGADSGTLTLMAAAKKDVFEQHYDILEAIGEKIYHVGEEIGLGQVVKSCLQGMMGPVYEGLFEALVLGSKAGLDPSILSTVINDSMLGSRLTKNATNFILQRKFENTGSHIDTMYKDLSISVDLAKELEVPMFAATAALQMFRSAKTVYPNGENWSIVQVLEKLANTEVKSK